MRASEARNACLNCGCSGQHSRLGGLTESIEGSIVLAPDGTQLKRSARSVSKKKDSDQEFFQMTYLALLLPHP